eukprot:3204161-Karenia_brevis.AAC.1
MDPAVTEPSPAVPPQPSEAAAAAHVDWLACLQNAHWLHCQWKVVLHVSADGAAQFPDFNAQVVAGQDGIPCLGDWALVPALSTQHK